LSGGGGDGDAMVQISERKLDHVRRMALAMHSGNAMVADSEAVKTLADACERLRDVPLARLSDKYKGLVDRLSEKLGKQIQFECTPAHLELSPHFFQPIDEALVHLLRNSIDHGVETASDRVVGGKPERGTIHLELAINDEQVSLILSDDGAGIDLERVSAKAIEQGFATTSEIARMNDEQKMQLVFESGISTASSISDVSGRGVGMAAVKDCIEALGGAIQIKSVRGKGSQTTLQLPARFAV
jgi:two-component system chemotaxis sensor kinase CheA